MVKFILAALFLALLAPVLASAPGRAGELPRAVPALEWLPQAQFAGDHVARDKDFYREAG